MYYTGIWS